MEEKIINLIESTIAALGFDIVKLSIQGGKRKVLQIMIDHKSHEKVTIGDCRLVSRNVAALLDVEDLIADKYFLEVSSSGLERPLVKITDFQKFIDHEIKIVLKEQIDGKTKYKGKVTVVDGNTIIFKSNNAEELQFDLLDIKNANLVLSDEMFKKLLNKKKINKLGETNE